MFSATPLSLPSKHLRRISSWPSFSIWSLVAVRPEVVILTLLGVWGTWLSERLRMRSYNAARRELVGVAGTDSDWLTGVDGRSTSDADGVLGKGMA